MKKRYYLLMLSTFPMVFFFDTIYFVVSKQWSFENAIGVTLIEALIFIALNLLGIYFIFKPIEKFLHNQINFEKVSKKIDSLPYISALWGCFLGVIHSTIAIVMTVLDEKFTGGILKVIYFIIAILFSYCVFISIYIFFLIGNFTMKLKEYVHIKFNLLFPHQNFKIWYKLAIVYAVLAISFVFMLVDMYLSGVLDDINKHGFVIMDIIFTPVVAFIVIYLITAELKKSMNLLLDSFKEVRNGNFSIKAPVISNDEFGVLTADFNSMVAGLQERELIRDAFGKYVTKTVADEILKNKVNLSGEVRLVTIFFTDIENYTTISENMKPEDVVEMLNDYFSSIVEIVSKHKGIVNKFIGDSVFAIFNAPIDDPEHPQNAIRTALEIQHLINNRKFGKGIKLNTRIGINTGIIVMGNIGSKDRLEYTAIGDEVNIASRLEQLNKNYGTRILVGEKTYQMAKNDFKFEQIGKIELKGKREAVEVYKVLM